MAPKGSRLKGTRLHRAVVVQSEQTSTSDSDDDASEGGSDGVDAMQAESNSDGNGRDGATTVAEGNASWADSMAKILRASGTTAPLSRAKLDADVKFAKESEADPKSAKDETSEVADAVKPRVKKKQHLEERKKFLEKKRQKQLWENMGRVKPSVTEKERERTLARIATKGVIQLFNAVRQHQTTLGGKLKNAGSSEVKREKVFKKVDKGTFLDLLKGQSRSREAASVKTTAPLRQSADGCPTWNVLRDDFMMGASMKDWDQNESDS